MREPTAWADVGPGASALAATVFSALVALVAAVLNARFNQHRAAVDAKKDSAGHELQSFTAINDAARALMEELRAELTRARLERAVAVTEGVDLAVQVDRLTDLKARLEVEVHSLTVQLHDALARFEAQVTICEEWSAQNKVLLRENAALLRRMQGTRGTETED